jgi:hypothetical protein
VRESLLAIFANLDAKPLSPRNSDFPLSGQRRGVWIMAKTTCAISRAEFKGRAKPIKLTMEYDGKTYVQYVSAKEFSTGSMGWNLNDKATFTLEGRDVSCQIGLNVTVIGSKELPAV